MKLVLTKSGKLNTETRKLSWWKTKKIETLYHHIMNQTQQITTDCWSERLYCFSKELKENPKCEVCGGHIRMFYNLDRGYASTCSINCSNKSPKRTEKIKTTYSLYSQDQIKKHTEKISNGFLQKYGVDNISKTQHFKDIYKKRMNDNYGVDNYFEMTDKVKESFNSIYGCDNPQQVQEIKQRTLKTNREKYGEMIGACPAEQTKKTCMKRFGAEYFFGSKAGKINENTLRERYGWSEDELLEWRKSKCVSFGKASKESLGVFIPLYKNLRKIKDVKRNQIWFGVDGSLERFINNSIDLFFYDFCVITPSSKFIIEYNGIVFHPKSPTQEGWKHPFNQKLTPQILFDRDQRKKQLAIKSGYDYLTLWSDNTIMENIKTATNFINERL